MARCNCSPYCFACSSGRCDCICEKPQYSYTPPAPPTTHVSTPKHVGWFATVGDGVHFIPGTSDPRKAHDNGKPYYKAIAVKPDDE